MSGAWIPFRAAEVRPCRKSGGTEPATAAVEVAHAERPDRDGRGGDDDYLQPWKILAPVHPDESAETVLRLKTIAGTLSGELTVLSVIDSFGDEDGGSDPLTRDIFLHGDPASRIRHYSSLLRPDLILMPSRPTRFRMIFWQRSVLADILHRTNHAVMVVPAATQWAADHRVGTVVCVVQLDGTDEPVIDRAAAIASRVNSELTLLHVLPEVNDGTLLAGLEPFDFPLSLPVASERMGRLKVPCRSHRVEIRTGDVHRNIAAVARELNADLIVTQRDVCRWHCPSIRSLQRHVACPVLSVASPDSDLLARTDLL